MIGYNVKRLREQAGWSQAELAERIGCAQTSISAVERGVVSGRVPKLVALAEVFGVTVDDLLSAPVPAPASNGAAKVP